MTTASRPTHPLAPSIASIPRSTRVFNYSAGPGCMPEDVLAQIQQDVWDCRNSGVGILEHSHRAKVYDKILAEAFEDCRKVGSIPSTHHILFLTGGSTQQNFMVPMNFLPADKSGVADYFNTGYWANRSIEDAKIFGHIHEAASSKPANFAFIPSHAETKYSASPRYVHYTSNNTIFGTQHHAHAMPTPPKGAALVCDMCSDIFSRPVDYSKYDLVYASAQKNLGPAGVSIVIIRDEFMKTGRRDIPHMLQYRTFAEQESRPNTPPVFPIYCVGLMLKWILAKGGVGYFEKFNADKAKIVYDVLDQSKFYKPHARLDSRSLMNITFRCPTPELDDKFCKDAEKAGLDCLKGHRATGGMRASLYNAMPMDGAKALAQFMREFERTA
jgi:phosphoserine aminotransferase